jgi:hypothetical protein
LSRTAYGLAVALFVAVGVEIPFALSKKVAVAGSPVSGRA